MKSYVAASLNAVINSTKSLIFAVDENYQYLIFNKEHAQKMKEIYGAEIEVGEDILQYIRGHEDVRAVKENFDRALRGDHFTRIQKIGDETLERIYFELTFNPIYDPEEKNITGVAVFARDLTEQIEWERALEESEEKYRRIFENIQDVFYRTDADGIITDISPSIERYSKFKPREVIGKPVAQFYFDPREREKLLKSIYKYGEVIDFEVRLKTKTGELTYTSVNANLVRDEENNIKGIEGSMRDISERKKAEDKLLKVNTELKKLNRQKDKLFSVIAHDLQNLVSGLTGVLDIIQEEIETLSEGEIRNYINMARQNAYNTFDLLQDLLKWSRSQFEDAKLEKETLSLNNSINQVIERLNVRATEKMIKLETRLEEGLTLQADKEMLHTVLRNLISNAIKFSHFGETVTVEAEYQNDKIVISVIDRGVGIKKEDQEKVLAKQVNFTTKGTKGERGSGLGVDLCIDFVERHNGEILLKSEPGKGTTFTVLLPIESQNESVQT